MMCCVCCRPSSQPYVMDSEVAKAGTSNGYPMKAQLQIIGKCPSTNILDYLYFTHFQTFFFFLFLKNITYYMLLFKKA